MPSSRKTWKVLSSGRRKFYGFDCSLTDYPWMLFMFLFPSPYFHPSVFFTYTLTIFNLPSSDVHPFSFSKEATVVVIVLSTTDFFDDHFLNLFLWRSILSPLQLVRHGDFWGIILLWVYWRTTKGDAPLEKWANWKLYCYYYNLFQNPYAIPCQLSSYIQSNSNQQVNDDGDD